MERVLAAFKLISLTLIMFSGLTPANSSIGNNPHRDNTIEIFSEQNANNILSISRSVAIENGFLFLRDIKSRFVSNNYRYMVDSILASFVLNTGLPIRYTGRENLVIIISKDPFSDEVLNQVPLDDAQAKYVEAAKSRQDWCLGSIHNPDEERKDYELAIFVDSDFPESYIFYCLYSNLIVTQGLLSSGYYSRDDFANFGNEINIFDLMLINSIRRCVDAGLGRRVYECALSSLFGTKLRGAAKE